VKVGDLVQRGDVVGLITEVMIANEIQWIKIIANNGKYVGGSNRYFSQIDWKVVSESR